MSDHATGFQFDPEWRTSLLTVLLLPLLVCLGFWQLQRAQEKSDLASSWEQRRHQSAVDVLQLDVSSPEALAYTPVELTGSFLPDRYFLLDNRIHAGRFGYEVLGLFVVANTDVVVLVNRGWIAADQARVTLPEVPAVEGAVTISGHVYVAPGSPYLLAEQTFSAGWPKRIQAVEMDKLIPNVEAATDFKVFPYPVRIDIAVPGSLAVAWKIINVSPEKHTAYAVQWFTMAVVLGIFYFLRSSNLSILLSRGPKELD